MLGGNPAPGSSPATSLLYAGEQFDTGLQMYYNRARYYNQNVGRFNRMDPFAGNNRDPQSLHKYLYTYANPINSIDPSGNIEFSLSGMFITAMIVGIISGIMAGTVTAIKGGTTQQIINAATNWFWTGFAVGAIVYGGIWAVHSLWLLIFGGGGTAAILNNGTDLYRVVNKAELNIIRSTNSFQFRPTDARPAGEAAGKFFWGSYQEALVWQQNMAKLGETDLTIVKTTIDSTAPVWRAGGIVDGIGNSYFVAMEYLTGIIKVVSESGG